MKKQYISPEFCVKNSVLLIRTTQREVVIGITEKADEILKNRLSAYFNDYTVSFEVIESEEFAHQLSRFFSQESQSLPIGEKEKRHSGSGHSSYAIDEIADDAPVINLLNTIILEGVVRKASDIHIECVCKGARVRYREDGILTVGMHITDEKASSLAVRIKMMAQLNVLEKRRAQDGRLDIQCSGIPLDVRVSIVPSVYGESIVLRLLNKSSNIFTVDMLGFSEQHMHMIHQMLYLPSGLILLTGPTGSGKTTTLCAFLRQLNSDKVKIVSIEDPVEYRIDGIVQIQTDDAIGMSFDSLLRRIFRQDPDIIMIGEIRDSQTAELAVRTALTGHVVFATLHTNRACEAPMRLRDMGIPAYLIASVLKGVISQRLVRRLNTQSEKKYSGRTLIAEILVADDEIAQCISDGTNRMHLESVLQAKGIPLIAQDAREKVHSGITDTAEIERELGVCV